MRPAAPAAPASVLDAADRGRGVATVAPLLLLVLTGFIGLQPLSTDLYLPSLPAIAEHFAVGPAAVQQTLGLFVLAFALSQLVAGPLTDRFGRRPVALTGLALYVASSLVAAAAEVFGVLLAARIGQALGVCCTVVCARAIVRDLWEPDAGARVMARMFTWMALAIAGGPLLGGVLQTAFGWRAAFVVLAAMSGVLLAVAAMRLPETNRHRNRSATRLGPLFRAYRDVASSPAFRAYALLAMFSYGALFAFLAGSSFVLMRTMGLSAREYGAGFVAWGVVYLLGTLLARKVIARRGIRRATYPGAAWELFCGALMLGLALAGVRHPVAMFGPMILFIVGHAVLQPCSQAGAIAQFPRNAGAAAALLGAITLAGTLLHVAAAAVAGFLAPAGHDGVVQLSATVFVATLGAAATAFRLVRRDGRT